MGASRNGRDTDGGTKSSRKPGKVGTGYDAEFRGYINLDLSPGDKERFSAWLLTTAASHTFDAAVTDGVNIAIKVDPKGAGFMASGTMRREDSPNAGLCATARAKTPELALWRLVFTLELLYVTGHWEDRQPMADPDRW
jgi:hypothetical protein